MNTLKKLLFVTFFAAVPTLGVLAASQADTIPIPDALAKHMCPTPFTGFPAGEQYVLQYVFVQRNGITKVYVTDTKNKITYVVDVVVGKDGKDKSKCISDIGAGLTPDQTTTDPVSPQPKDSPF